MTVSLLFCLRGVLSGTLGLVCIGAAYVVFWLVPFDWGRAGVALLFLSLGVGLLRRGGRQ